MDTSSDKSLMTPAEVREFFGRPSWSRAAFWQFVRRNNIPFIRLGARTYRFERVAVQAYLASRTCGRVVGV
jgi:excisionase family DNA binding protein